MAVTLYVWRKDAQHIGHASLHIGTVYVSFWPEDAAGKKDVTLKQSHRAAFMETLEEDILNEGNRQPQALTIERLDEAAMGSGQGTRKLTQALMLRYRSTAIWTPEQLWLYAMELRSSPPR